MPIRERNGLTKPKLGKTWIGLAEPEDAIATSTGLARWDVAILDELQRDARLSNAEPAMRIGLSAAPTWRLRGLPEVVSCHNLPLHQRRRAPDRRELATGRPQD